MAIINHEEDSTTHTLEAGTISDRILGSEGYQDYFERFPLPSFFSEVLACFNFEDLMANHWALCEVSILECFTNIKEPT